MTNATPFVDEFDAMAFEAFADAGMAKMGSYLPTGEDAEAFERRMMLDSALQVQGEYGQILSPRTVITFWLADGALGKGATATLGGNTYKLDSIATDDANDGSLQKWVVRNG